MNGHEIEGIYLEYWRMFEEWEAKNNLRINRERILLVIIGRTLSVKIMFNSRFINVKVTKNGVDASEYFNFWSQGTYHNDGYTK